MPSLISHPQPSLDRTAKSIIDYVARFLVKRFLDPAHHAELGITTPVAALELDDEDEVAAAPVVAVAPKPARKLELKQHDAGSCRACGDMLVQTGKCTTCTGCGTTGGCG